MGVCIKAFFAFMTIGASAVDPKKANKSIRAEAKEDNEKFQEIGKGTQAMKARRAEEKKKKKPGLPRTRLARDIPQHIKNHTRHVTAQMTAIPISHIGGCGEKMRIGLKKTPEAEAVWKGLNFNLKPQSKSLQFLQASEHPGRNSMAVPGAGADQVMKDVGKSTTGTVDGTEPYVTVLKDGFFEQGCHHDVMYKSGDKYGNHWDEYKKGDIDVSIVRYKELVLEHDRKAMTPTVCFEFCRTVPNMVYFGLVNGGTCYCTPYFTPGAGNYPPRDTRGAHCDSPCPGDETTMCGNMDGKSSVFEMHLCDDTATDLTEALDGAKQALDYFMETSMLAKKIGEKMIVSAMALQKAAGLTGAPGASDMAQKAMAASKSLTQAFLMDSIMTAGASKYTRLLTAYHLGKDTEGKDFLKPANAEAAELATHNMKANMGSVISLAKSIHEEIKLCYPIVDSVSFGDAPYDGDSAAMKIQPLLDGEELAEPDFRVASYAYDTTYVPAQSSCSGAYIGLPMMGLGQPACALACEATVYPDVCVGYSFYTVTGGDDICFLMKDIAIVETFVGPEVALLQKGKAEAEPAAAFCGIKMSMLTTGYKPSGGWKKTDRSFGGGAGIALSQDVTEYDVTDKKSVTLGTVTMEHV